MKSNQKGFSAAEALIILVIVGVIGGAGWYVWQSKNKSDSASTTNNTTQSTTPLTYKRTTTVPSTWKTYTNEKYKISLAYPTNWTVSDSTTQKEASDSMQNVYSVNATEVFVLCYKSPDIHQGCSAQININNQPFAQSVAQLRKYYQSNASDTPYKETALLIDGHKAVEFRTEAKGYPAQKEYLVNANGFTYGLTTVYEGDPKDTSGQQRLSAKDSLTMFESIKID